MRLAVGSGDGQFGILGFERAMQPRHQIARQERAIGRGAQDELYLGPVRRSPVERRQNAGERSGKIGDAVGNDRQAERRKARGIAIGVEDEAVALRLQPRDHAIEDGAAGDRAHRLVAAAHPPRQPAGEQHAGNFRVSRQSSLSPLRLCRADSSST